MKSRFFYSLLFLSQLLSISKGFSQLTISTDCSNSVNVTQYANFGSFYIQGVFATRTNCTQYFLGPYRYGFPYFNLKKKSGSTWVAIKQWNANTNDPSDVYPSFSSLDLGIYRVTQTNPVATQSTGCNNNIQLYDSQERQIGTKGQIYNGLNMSISNEITVGAFVQSDVNWNFTGSNLATTNGYFDPANNVSMDMSGVKNYNGGSGQGWWLAVFEQGGANRYWSNGWHLGALPSIITLQSEFPGIQFSHFPISYGVQFAVSSSCNSQWVNLDRNFAYCESGQGCKIAENESISIIPNPTNSFFRLQNLDTRSGNTYNVKLTDLSGRNIKTFEGIGTEDLNISEIPTGLYIVSILNWSNQIYNTKLSIVK